MSTLINLIEGIQEYAMSLLIKVLPAGASQKNNVVLTPTVTVM
jgi:hypothetical protein